MLGLFYSVSGVGGLVIVTDWHYAVASNSLPAGSSQIGFFLCGLWYLGTGLSLIVGTVLMSRKADRSGARVVSLTCLSAGAIAVWTAASWRTLNNKSFMIEALLVWPAIALVMFMSLRRAKWNDT
jgi:hypothetical protein